MSFRSYLLASLLAASACAGASANIAGTVTYAKDAQGNFELGEKALKGHSYEDATAYFQYLKNKFPYSHFAPLAELRMADSNFEQEKYVEAVDAYKNFIKDHPTNKEVDYAGFRIGLSHYKDIPTDIFIVPPSYEKDQAQIKDAQTSLKDFLATYPDSTYVAKAKDMLADVRKRLARHELYVAEFYEKHGRPRAAAWRYEGLARDYPDTPFGADAKKAADLLYAKLGPGAHMPQPETLKSSSADKDMTLPPLGH
jgi:outer membrane protein assembly factor BamD